MQQLVINGPSRLSGEVAIDGAKNAALPILAASLLIQGVVALDKIPDLCDVKSMLSLLSCLGVRVEYKGNLCVLDAKLLSSCKAEYELVKKMRASVLVLGPLLARMGRAQVALPGGCSIGARPVDQHLSFMRALGGVVDIKDGLIEASAPNGLEGCTYRFSVVTVTGTENAIMAAVLARGKTVLENAACEPEIESLIEFLNSCGARIQITSDSVIEIEGVASLHPPGQVYRVIGDRIEAGTYLLGAMMTQGDVVVAGVNPDHLSCVFDHMEQAGALITIDRVAEKVRLQMLKRPEAVSIETGVYPHFPTDLQAQWMAMACVARGKAVIKETIFENRFMHACELMRMGAKLVHHGNEVCVEGVMSLKAAPVMASDLRASASLVMAAASAQGESVISRIYHIDRGYANLDEKLRQLGVNARRAEENVKNIKKGLEKQES